MRRLLSFKVFRMFMSALALATLVLSVAPLTNVSAASQEGAIQLQVIAPPAGAPWVGVQWQDPAGMWRNIDAWVAPLDPTQGGYVNHAVDPASFGTGPYRWIVWDKQGGKVVAMSASFSFPTYGTVVGSVIDLSAPPIPVTGAVSPGLGIAQNNTEGAIQLQLLNLSATMPWVGVQWQDFAGVWHNIDAWVAPLSSTQGGYVNHGVDPIHFGTGPYRWIVWDKQGGKVMAMSAPFAFPMYGTVVGSVIDLSMSAQ